jgi:hypothetical protein
MMEDNIKMEGPGKPSGAEINETHQLLVYADDVNLLGYNIDGHAIAV